MHVDLTESYFDEVVYFNFPVIMFWWYYADTQSREQTQSRHNTSKHCYEHCSMCSHHQLRNGTILTQNEKDSLPVTVVVLPLKQKCCQKRVAKFMIPSSHGPPRVIHQLLMQAGDIETNPGPGKGRVLQSSCSIGMDTYTILS